MKTIYSTIACALMVVFAGGCSSSTVYNGHAYTLETHGTERGRVIEAVRGVLTDHRFVIDRVDGRRGVVTTAFKSTQGIASPWDTEQESFKEEGADFVNQHERAVRVTIGDDGTVEVTVLVQRVHRPGWRIETESISRSTHAVVIGADGRREQGRTVSPIGIDEDLARRIGEAISSRISADRSAGQSIG